MRGIGTVIVVGFMSVILFTIVAPGILEPVVDVFVNHPGAENSDIDAQSYGDSMLRSVLVWGPLFVLGSGVLSAVVWYFRRERASQVRRIR